MIVPGNSKYNFQSKTEIKITIETALLMKIDTLANHRTKLNIKCTYKIKLHLRVYKLVYSQMSGSGSFGLRIPCVKYVQSTF